MIIKEENTSLEKLKEEKRRYYRAYYIKNKEKRREYNRRYWEKRAISRGRNNID